MATTLSYTADISAEAAVLIGDRSLIANALKDYRTQCKITSEVNVPKAFTEGDIDHATLWADNNQITVVHLTQDRSRNMGSIRSDLVADLVSRHVPKNINAKVVLVVENEDQAYAAGAAVARAFPLYSRKTNVTKNKDRTVSVGFSMKVSDTVKSTLQSTGDNIRLAARLVDAPCGELHTNAYLAEVENVVKANESITAEIIKGEDLLKQNFGGVWAVGKAAANLPAVAILKYTPKTASVKSVVALVGKGIVYDTGGLSLKGPTNMPTMKSDMGGSAACLGAIQAAAQDKYPGTVYAVLCIAENAVGPLAQRPDDIYTGHSGKTVEINNTDAEGRLVLADGVSYASKIIKPTHIIDIATLTGAQMITTGQKFAAVLSSSESFEKEIVAAGKRSGDWCYPILYAKEILFSEFDSKVADMKNSVKNRMNAQSSCAGHFVEDHLCKTWEGKWAHIDIAGPSFQSERGTGYGVALLRQVLDEVRKSE